MNEQRLTEIETRLRAWESSSGPVAWPEYLTVSDANELVAEVRQLQAERDMAENRYDDLLTRIGGTL